MFSVQRSLPSLFVLFFIKYFNAEAEGSNLEKYSQSAEINKFGARFKYSKALCVIDNSSDAITSNITKVVKRRDLRLAINSIA